MIFSMAGSVCQVGWKNQSFRNRTARSRNVLSERKRWRKNSKNFGFSGVPADKIRCGPIWRRKKEFWRRCSERGGNPVKGSRGPLDRGGPIYTVRGQDRLRRPNSAGDLTRCSRLERHPCNWFKPYTISCRYATRGKGKIHCFLLPSYRERKGHFLQEFEKCNGNTYRFGYKIVGQWGLSGQMCMLIAIISVTRFWMPPGRVPPVFLL